MGAYEVNTTNWSREVTELNISIQASGSNSLTSHSMDDARPESTYGQMDMFGILLLVKNVIPSLLLSVTILIWMIYYRKRPNTDNETKMRLPPGSMGLPFIGETFSLAINGYKFFEDRRNRYGNVYKTHLLGCPIIRVSGSENVKKVLLNENSLVCVYWPESVRVLLGDGAISSAVGNLHKVRRRGLQKAFNYEALDDYVHAMQRIVRGHLTKWCQQDVVLGYQECKHLTFATAAETLVGFDMASEEHQSLITVFDTWVDNLFSLPYRIPGLGFSKGLKARQHLIDKIGESLKKRKTQNSKETGTNASASFLDALSRLLDIQGEDSLSEEELKDICLELLFAGHATTASAATSLLIELLRNRSVIEKIQGELTDLDLLGSDPDDLSLSILSRMDYVSAVIKEVLRTSPPVGGAYRKIIKSFSLDGYHIPAGWSLLYSIRDTHSTSEVFPGLTEFDPDRWLTHSTNRDDAFHHLPFGGGSRACVGKEFAKLFLKVFVVEAVRTCSWALVNSDIKMKLMPVPHPADGLPLRFTSTAPAPVI